MGLKIRSQKPPKFSAYEKYKKYLRAEFEHSCVYCNVREPEIGGSKSFHIDHYQPKQKFPEKKTDYSNLFYSCRDCNSYKGAFWPSSRQILMRQFILNPCDYDFDKHFDRQSIIWTAKSKVAEWNLSKLRLNSPTRQQIREDRAYFLLLIQELEEQERKIRQFLSKAGDDQKIRQEIEQKLVEIQKRIEFFKRKVNGPMD